MMPQPDPPREAATARDAGLSLAELSAGFAEMLSAGHDPYAPVRDAESPLAPVESELQAVDAPPAAASEPAADVSPRSILEAMLFVGHPQNEPLTGQRVASLMRGVSTAEVDELVRDLNAQYAANACPYAIVGDGAGYRLMLRPEYQRVRARFFGRTREARLSRAAIEVLALVAYNDSLSGEDISRLRGRPSGAILAQLVRRQLLRIERTQDRPRVARYATTPRFLQLFGLESLADLPRSQTDEPS